jgi:hypothetical protein
VQQFQRDLLTAIDNETRAAGPRSRALAAARRGASCSAYGFGRSMPELSLTDAARAIAVEAAAADLVQHAGRQPARRRALEQRGAHGGGGGRVLRQAQDVAADALDPLGAGQFGQRRRIGLAVRARHRAEGDQAQQLAGLAPGGQVDERVGAHDGVERCSRGQAGQQLVRGVDAVADAAAA